jgi:CheY-like chemotaxis protein
MSALVLGQFHPEKLESLQRAFSRGGVDIQVHHDLELARMDLAETRERPGLVLVDVRMLDLEEVVRWVRSTPSLFGAMVLALVPSADDATFVRAHQKGADDVVLDRDLPGITRRARAYREYDPSIRPELNQGRAIVAHPRDSRRILIGRTLRLAGYSIDFATSDGEVADLLARPPVPTIAVFSESLPPSGGLHAALTMRRHPEAQDVPVVLVGTLGELRALGSEAETFHRLALADEAAPPADLLFVTNELLRPGVKNIRASQRVLFAALCAFRPAGQLHAVMGLTYNISREGLYIQTLDPPERGAELWFELRPPRAPRAIHLRGEVVWVRRHETGKIASAPPGFAIRILEDACPPADLHAYRAAYQAHVEAPRMVA